VAWQFDLAVVHAAIVGLFT